MKKRLWFPCRFEFVDFPSNREFIDFFLNFSYDPLLSDIWVEWSSDWYHSFKYLSSGLLRSSNLFILHINWDRIYVVSIRVIASIYEEIPMMLSFKIIITWYNWNTISVFWFYPFKLISVITLDYYLQSHSVKNYIETNHFEFLSNKNVENHFSLISDNQLHVLFTTRQKLNRVRLRD